MSKEHIHIPDLRTYAYHQRAAEILLESPERLNDIYVILNHWAEMEGTDAHVWAIKWIELINGMDATQVAELIVQKGENFDYYRKSSPFAGLLTEQERLKILNTYKFNYE